jgi:hypothetical protein
MRQLERSASALVHLDFRVATFARTWGTILNAPRSGERSYEDNPNFNRTKTLLFKRAIEDLDLFPIRLFLVDELQMHGRSLVGIVGFTIAENHMQ